MKNKQFGLFAVTQTAKYAELLKIMKICDYSCLNGLERNQINGQLPLHVHMHLKYHGYELNGCGCTCGL